MSRSKVPCSNAVCAGATFTLLSTFCRRIG
jgi:hypothetical protein